MNQNEMKNVFSAENYIRMFCTVTTLDIVGCKNLFSVHKQNFNDGSVIFYSKGSGS